MASNNPLQCSVYGPTASDCRCERGMTHSTFCGYSRCIGNASVGGCLREQLFNATDCSAAPWSTCVTEKVRGQYFADGSFHALTVCSAYSDVVGARSYEIRTPLKNQHGTITSDRLCSICSVCPSGYDTIRCTATADTRCVRPARLSVGAIVAIVLSVVVLSAVAIAAFLAGRRRSRQIKEKAYEIYETERMIEESVMNLQQVQKASSLMMRAWQIDSNDLTFHKVLGEGASSRVYAGRWGYVLLRSDF